MLRSGDFVAVAAVEIDDNRAFKRGMEVRKCWPHLRVVQSQLGMSWAG